jgi:hypothetical protein
MEREEGRPDQELGAELEADAQDLEERGEQVGEHIEDARSDWERKKQDDAVPGAQPDDDEPPASGESPLDEPGGPA